MATIMKQVRMVFDLNKCLGCHTCSMACKTVWTDRNQGQQYMYWNNVETRPGSGYPKGWETMGGGFPGCGNQVSLTSPIPSIATEYGAPWEYNYGEVLTTTLANVGDVSAPISSQIVPSPDPAGPTAYSSNWDEDVGGGTFPDSYYFYLPRICNHCTKPACLAACTRKAIYKREEDGIVLVDQNRCRGYRHCIKGCPYKKVYWNQVEEVSQKCIFCYPRRTDKLQTSDPQPGMDPPFRANFCFTQCPGRIRYVGYSDNPNANVNKLIDVYQVALRLHPEFGTDPNLWYIPPLSPPVDGGTDRRIPVDFLANLFGDNCAQTHIDRVARINQIFTTIESARTGGNPGLAGILTAYAEADRLQL
ncbi:4Fe-4S dicluster domain-containing protein [Geobacter pickeringii]|uniref:4Fe-4S dicluster domain-containing protein n=1 Tax=Geobacter pickeringii TaxID=345632 RepID=UPI00068ADEF5|nr:4Fe-4S dicluster domain-containing protein [Geobacter pickeringii]